ncbi:MAG: hypothetical protein LBV76_06300 [Deltaproteobacteria bacterium]|jgi:hypothetical protein|nr:hypothetical protein [Deltaproteobacteria bacterium]
MPVNPIIAQVAPMEHVAKVVQQEQDSGPVKQAVLQASTALALIKANDQVEKTSSGEAGQKVTRRFDGRGKNKQGQTPEKFLGADNIPEETLAEALDQSIENEPTPDVWTGNIVNVKV